jgi:hypothetical protein
MNHRTSKCRPDRVETGKSRRSGNYPSINIVRLVLALVFTCLKAFQSGQAQDGFAATLKRDVIGTMPERLKRCGPYAVEAHVGGTISMQATAD